MSKFCIVLIVYDVKKDEIVVFVGQYCEMFV